jgi:PTS system nitrogen regulatory IIA component
MGIAVPHAQLPGAVPGFMLAARLHRAIEFDAPDSEPVDLAFLVLWSADDPKGLLEEIAEICRRVRDPDVLRRLRVAASAEDFLEALGPRGANDDA